MDSEVIEKLKQYNVEVSEETTINDIKDLAVKVVFFTCTNKAANKYCQEKFGGDMFSEDQISNLYNVNFIIDVFLFAAEELKINLNKTDG